jgi:hypothetical protein
MLLNNSQTYSREEIRKCLGGNSQEYLPHVNNVVVAACLTRPANPNAPDKILVGNGKNIKRWAFQLCRQKEPIPVFVKEGSRAWRYYGHFHVSDWSEDPKKLREEQINSDRDDITRIISLGRTHRSGRHHSEVFPLSPSSIQAIENTKMEARVYKRGRSRILREKAIEMSGGICAVCGHNFSKIAGGLGRSALQVHHRKQLAASDKPVLTSIRDLAVVCANCHMMLHSNHGRALTVLQLQSRLRA